MSKRTDFDLNPSTDVVSGDKGQKISAWLSERGSHEIYALEFLADDFKTKTGLDFPAYVRTFTWEQTRDAMKERGLGGTLKESKGRVVWGYMMAQDFARELTNHSSILFGRGSIMRDCITAIEKAGL